MSKVAVVILNWNGFKDTIELFESLYVYERGCDYYLLDNGSTDDSISVLKEYFAKSSWNSEICNLENFSLCSNGCNVKFVISDKNYGFAIGNNQILKRIINKYDYYILLNNDVILKESAITKLVGYATANQIDASSTKILRYSDNGIWYAGGKLNIFGERTYFNEKQISKYKNDFLHCTYITGCLLCINNQTLVDVGLLTENFFHGEEDFQYSYSLKKNKKKVGVLLNATIYHKAGSSSGKLPSHSVYSVHFTNRVVDKKLLYGKLKFFFWKRFYLTALFLKTWKLYGSFRQAREIIQVIKKYSKNDNVRCDVFKEIIAHKWKYSVQRKEVKK